MWCFYFGEVGQHNEVQISPEHVVRATWTLVWAAATASAPPDYRQMAVLVPAIMIVSTANLLAAGLVSCILFSVNISMALELGDFY